MDVNHTTTKNSKDNNAASLSSIHRFYQKNIRAHMPKNLRVFMGKFYSLYSRPPFISKKMRKYFKNQEFLIKNMLIDCHAETYSQHGEDLIMKSIIESLGIDVKDVIYLDLGTNHPRIINNTFLLYKNNASGILVEPNPDLSTCITKERPRDQYYQAGIGFSDSISEAPYYRFNENVYNTFSKEEADTFLEKFPIKLEEIVNLPLLTFEQICKDTPVMLISLDTEGLQYEILQSIPFEKYSHIRIICVEDDEQRSDIISFMESKSFVLFGETVYNLIFVLKDDLNTIINNSQCKRYYHALKYLSEIKK